MTHKGWCVVKHQTNRNEYLMTINIFVIKGDLNGKIVVVRFFFCQVYNKMQSLEKSVKLGAVWSDPLLVAWLF